MRHHRLLEQKLHPYDHVIWDWNGTLLADVEQAWQANVRMLQKRALPIPSLDEHRRNFCFPIKSYYERLGFDLAIHKFEELSSEYVREYDKLVKSASLFEGTSDLLAGLTAAGKTLAILSAAEQRHLDFIVTHYELKHHFAYIYGLNDHYGFSKLQRGMELLITSGMTPRKTILVGDTDHDLKVGNALGVDVLLIADGHQAYEHLSALHDNVLPSRFPALT